ncbi:MAG: carbohydrate deacetylase [Vicinamibacteria bacterium]
MPSTKRLIVNADDFGRTPGVNRGIVEAHVRGIVTSTTLMVAYASAAEAPRLAAENPRLAVGLHVALTGGPSVLSQRQVPSLVDSSGRLPPKPDGLGQATPHDVLAEARAQLKRFREIMGRAPTHLDSHHHSQRVPAVLEALVTLAWETGLPVRSVSLQMNARFKHEGIPTTERFVESFYDGGATLEGLLRILAQLDFGTTEIMCHPAVVDDELRAGSGYTEPRTRELEVLTHTEVRHAIQAGGIRLVHFGEL